MMNTLKREVSLHKKLELACTRATKRMSMVVTDIAQKQQSVGY